MLPFLTRDFLRNDTSDPALRVGKGNRREGEEKENVCKGQRKEGEGEWGSPMHSGVKGLKK